LEDPGVGHRPARCPGFQEAGRVVRRLIQVLSAIGSEMDSMCDKSGPCPPKDVTIPSDTVEARRVQDEIEQALKAHQFAEREIFSIILAFEEAVVNAIKHGNQMDRSKTVRIAYSVALDRFAVQITDEGRGFDPCDVPDPTAVENLERPCGRGLMLMRHYMSEVSFNERGNSVYMCKNKNGTTDR
jgi:serine/threonine-protein kinase RsbW